MIYETKVVAGSINMKVLEDDGSGRMRIQLKRRWWIVQNRRRKMP
jgi:hypothetical protein